jgi:hypothetical protein
VTGVMDTAAAAADSGGELEPAKGDGA